jgi:uncharacterized protein (DUF2126 family)/transglutaminase-like putative cysteine protease
MAIRVALRHVTEYRYDRPVTLGPQVIRLRPAPHSRTPIPSYSLTILPEEHFLNWQQDPFGNYLARMITSEKTTHFKVAVELTADLTVINPFDFFVEAYAEEFPFEYEPALKKDLLPFLECAKAGPKFEDYLKTVNRTKRRTISFLVDLNLKLCTDVKYLIRLEPGVQTPDETLTTGSGSCRDSAWLMVQILRRMGLAARFVSGYLIQLTADIKSLDGPSGPEKDFTDLHAWCEVYLPGAGWVGLDPTSGLMTGEGHIPLAATPDPSSAAPVSGGVDECETEFGFEMSVKRVFEDPRVTLPYTEDQWAEIDQLGQVVDEHLVRNDVRLTMGGEPTFVSIDDQEGAEWNTAAVGKDKQRLSNILLRRLRERFAPGSLLHFGQGKWYPGESLPRWAYSCMWRTDGEPIWSNPDLLANVFQEDKVTVEKAGEFMAELADRLGVDGRFMRPAYEDVWHTIEAEQKLPVDVDPRKFDLDADEDRRRLAKIIESGVSKPVGYALPLTKAWWQAQPRWTSGPWPFRSERLFLLPGDSPIGLRLPLDSLPVAGGEDSRIVYTIDPFAEHHPLPGYQEIRRRTQGRTLDLHAESGLTGQTRSDKDAAQRRAALEAHRQSQPSDGLDKPPLSPVGVIATAMCIEPRGGRLHVFMPPVTRLEDYLELVGIIENTAEHLKQPVVIEGYLPPSDPRLQVLKVTPDPGVIEVNVHPARDWEELKAITSGIYEEAHYSRLGTEKFQLDGKHTGTGGGNHVVLGAQTPADSPFLRRPDLLRSMIGYWNNHPALSYLFSGQFIGPTSQAPRADEGRQDAIYEMEIAFDQIREDQYTPPWLVDRVFRHLLIDITGNTHRAEICIDKLYSPDHSAGRLGLVELRGFEMPPHAQMSLTQQLLVRALVTMFWEKPYRQKLTRWGTGLHDRFLLPHFLRQDLRDILSDLRRHGFAFRDEWFDTHYEFRCPRIGEVRYDDIQLELRTAIEPWYVLGEEPGGGGTTRYVDSSVERMQLLLTGIVENRHVLVCNGRVVPMHSTGRVGEFVSGLRYRAWQPPSCLHPTIPVHTPLSFDIVDTFQQRSIGGCRYHIDHPGGLNPAVYPVNALEAECRRAARFVRYGQTGGRFVVHPEPPSAQMPYTMDLRRNPW